MSADDVFDAAVAIARNIVANSPEGERLNRALEHAQFVMTPWRQRNPVEWAQLNQAASEFAAPYLARIAELEAENKALRSQITRRDNLVDQLLGGLARVDEAERNVETVLSAHINDTPGPVIGSIHYLGRSMFDVHCKALPQYYNAIKADDAAPHINEPTTPNQSPICGHDRETLRWALRVQSLVDRGLPAVISGMSEQQSAALYDVCDPAILTATIAELMRGHGIEARSLDTKDGRCFIARLDNNADVIRIGFDMPKARAFALRLLNAPNATAQDIERMIGEL